jgi:integrase
MKPKPKPKSKRITGTLYQPTVTRYVSQNGRRVSKGTPDAKVVREKSATWRARYHDADGVTRTCSLFDDREASEAKLAVILQRERELKAGIRRRDPFEIHRTTPLLCPKCSGTTCVDAKGKPDHCVGNHLAAYMEYLDAKNNTPKHLQMTKSRLREAIMGCRFDVIDDLNAGRVSVWLKDQRSGGMSPATSNHYATAAKSFGNWLFKDRRYPENPFGHLTKVNARVDVRVVRRALDQEELVALVEAAEAGEPFRDLTGADKAMLYLMAAFTGLRSSELASLTPLSLDFRCNPPTLTVVAACSKHRREDVLPLHPGLAVRLSQWLQERNNRSIDAGVIPFTTKPADAVADGSGVAAPLFPGTWPDRAAKMLRRDLEAAREKWLSEAATDTERRERQRSDFLKYDTADGCADFHALRHKFVTDLAMNGVHPKLAKELARHSTITLTMDRYAHVGLLDMNAALESLPGMPTRQGPEQARNVSTGTDPSLVATLVATVSGNLGDSQELSREAAAAGDDSNDSRNVSSQEELSEDLTSPEKWWRGELNPRPAGYESAALTN